MILRPFVATALLACLAGPAHAQPPAPSPPEAAPAETGDAAAPRPTGDPGLYARVRDLERRLEALRPARPAAYFELGEEVAQEASRAEDRRLARQLYALAIELNRLSSARDPQLERSACLALAAAAETDADARWLRAMAGALDAPLGAAAGRVAPPRDPAALDLCSVLSYSRTGEGRRAQPLLSQPEVARLLASCDRLLGGGFPGGADRVRKALDDWPSCPQCRNRRTVKDAAGVHLCPTCKGTPGPQLSGTELLNQLRTEAAVLSGAQRSWAGQLIADAGAPLRELDLPEIAVTYGVSALAPIYRDGRWAPDPTLTPPSPPPAPPPPGPASSATAPSGETGRRAAP